jgi:hypothetical protein
LQVLTHKQFATEATSSSSLKPRKLHQHQQHQQQQRFSVSDLPLKLMHVLTHKKLATHPTSLRKLEIQTMRTAAAAAAAAAIVDPQSPKILAPLTLPVVFAPPRFRVFGLDLRV